MTLSEKINFKLFNNLDLTYQELCYVFSNIGLNLVNNRRYVKTCDAIIYLLKYLKSKQTPFLVDVINKYIQIYPYYTVRLDTLDDEFDCWKYKCNDKEVENYLINLAEKMKKAEYNSTLDRFKNSLQ